MTADTNGRITFLNPVAVALTGWQLEEAQDQPIQNVFRTINKQTHATADDIVSRVLREKRVVALADHTALLAKDGREIPIEDSAAPISAADGKVIGVVLVFHDVTERRRAEQEIFEAQERLKALVDALPVGVNFSDDLTCHFIAGNPTAMSQFEAKPGDNISASAPDDRTPFRQVQFFSNGRQISDSELAVQRAVTEDRAIPPFELEVQLPSGRKWFMEMSGAPIHDRQGHAIGGVAVTVDITERKRIEKALLHSEKLKAAQDELGKLSGKLIEAQERERRRIARELHDDICQQLALLSIEIDQAMQAGEVDRLQAVCRGSETEYLGRIEKASRHCSAIGHAVQALSHELHSSSLDYLGMVTAIRGFCREFSEKHKLTIKFTSAGIPNSLPHDVSLCLFRVVQEALRNAAKYSGANQIEVAMRGGPNGIELEVRDAGAGFDPEEAKNGGGLGLVSMQERVGLVRGSISIESKLNCGTKIRVTIPLETHGTTVRA